jgi:hypothetical protein
MKHNATPQEVACVKDGIAAVKAALAALKEEEKQNLQDLADYNAWQQGAMVRAMRISPRDPASIETYIRDKATAELWTNLFAAEPGRRGALEHRRDAAVMDLIERRLWAVTDYFEERFHSFEGLKVGGLENALAMAEKILSYRLPAHDPVVQTSMSIPSDWLIRSFDALLAHAVPERAT